MTLTQSIPAQDDAPPLPLLLAAGSLAQAMNAMLDAYAAQGGTRFLARYGPSGSLRQAIEAGEPVDVFASASIAHVQALTARGLLGHAHGLAHNALCVVARPELGLNDATLLDALCRPAVRVATSTPGSDPMGDYTWQFFRHAERVRAGLYRILDGKALKLSGAAVPPPGTVSPYVAAFAEDRVDAYVMYRTNAISTVKALPHLAIVPIPHALNVYSEYGIAAHPGSPQGESLLAFMLSSAGLDILKEYGFR